MGWEVGGGSENVVFFFLFFFWWGGGGNKDFVYDKIGLVSGVISMQFWVLT